MPNCSKIGQRRGEPRLLAALLLSLLLCGGCTGLAPIRERLQLPIPWPSSAQTDDPTHDFLTVWVWEEGAYTTLLREAIEQFQQESAITVELVVAAVIVDRLPNGNLVIAGRQEVRINGELRELTVSGIIRPEDVTADNRINHTQIAEARIAYGGRGSISTVQRPQWGQRIGDAIAPW